MDRQKWTERPNTARQDPKLDVEHVGNIFTRWGTASPAHLPGAWTQACAHCCAPGCGLKRPDADIRHLVAKKPVGEIISMCFGTPAGCTREGPLEHKLRSAQASGGTGGSELSHSPSLSSLQSPKRLRA